MEDDSFKKKITNISMLFLGGVILLVHLLLFKFNKYLFTIFICLYIITYSILITVFLYKKKECAQGAEFNILVYFSIYTIAMEALVLIMCIVFMIFENTSKSGY